MGFFKRLRRGLTKVGGKIAKNVVRTVVPGGGAIIAAGEALSTSRRLLTSRGSRPKTSPNRTAGGIVLGQPQTGAMQVSSPFAVNRPPVLSATSGTTLTQNLGPSMTARQEATQPPSRRPVFSTSPVDFGPFQFDPGGVIDFFTGAPSKPAEKPMGAPTNQMPAQMQGMNLGSLLMAGLMEKVMSKGSGDRALLEAIFSGNVQRFGPMFPTPTTNTPRGPQNISPRGYVTMYFGDQAVSVLKPIAECFGYKTYKPKSDLTKLRRKLTGAASAKRKVKMLAKKAGYSVKNTKTGI